MSSRFIIAEATAKAIAVGKLWLMLLHKSFHWHAGVPEWSKRPTAELVSGLGPKGLGLGDNPATGARFRRLSLGDLVA